MRRCSPLLLTGLLLASCQEKATTPVVVNGPVETTPESPTGPGLAFRLAPTVLDTVAGYDSAIATVKYADGTQRVVRTSILKVLSRDAGTIALPGIPLEDCRIEVEFSGGKDKPKIKVTIQIHVDPQYDVSAPTACDDDRVLADATVQENGDLVLKPFQDAWIGSADNGGDNNNGVGSELRLWEGGSMGVLDFGDLATILKGRKVAKAELVLHGWKGDIDIGDMSTDLSIDLGTIPRGWKEGNGDWYWFDGSPWNDYATAYSLWPGFLPPDCARNPSSAGGIRWIDDGGVREGFGKISTFVPEVDYGTPYTYPTAEQARVVRLDVTESVKSQIASGMSKGFGLRRATSSAGPRTSVAFYSKDHAPSVSPSLVIRFAN